CPAREVGPPRSRRGFSQQLRDGAALPQDVPALDLVEAAPHAVGLADPQRIFQAIDANGAQVADRLGLGFAGVLLVALLEVVRREEQGGVLAAARRSELPGRDVIVRVGHLAAGPDGQLLVLSGSRLDAPRIAPG